MNERGHNFGVVAERADPKKKRTQTPMDYASHFNRMFHYDNWATRAMLGAMQMLPQRDAKIWGLMAHLLHSQRIWLSRVAQTGADIASLSVSADMSIADFGTMLDDVHLRWSSALKSLTGAGFQGKIKYRNTKGLEFENAVEEILTHVINHSTHHRAQISMLLRQHGVTPPATDFILFAS